MRDIEHRGCRIEPQPYLSVGGRWMAKAIVVVSDRGLVRTIPVFGPLRTFATEEEADAWAVEIAKTWINKRG